ncbi:MAG: hypothetical protein ABW133_13790 [Polyangiaceae bacterium]
MRHSPDGCAGGRELLARDGECVVERCVCGTLYLSLGALTLRLHEEAFTQLASLLDLASKNLLRRDVHRSPDNSGTLVS